MTVATTQEPTTTVTTTVTTTITTTNYIHNHRILQQIPNPKTSKKKKNSKSSTKLQPNRSINEKTQPTIGGEIDKSKSNKISNPNRAEIQKQKNIPFFLVQSKQQNSDSVSSKRQI